MSESNQPQGERLTVGKIWADWVETRPIVIELQIPTNANLRDGDGVNGYLFQQMMDGLRDALGVHLLGAEGWAKQVAEEILND